MVWFLETGTTTELFLFLLKELHMATTKQPCFRCHVERRVEQGRQCSVHIASNYSIEESG